MNDLKRIKEKRDKAYSALKALNVRISIMLRNARGNKLCSRALRFEIQRIIIIRRINELDKRHNIMIAECNEMDKLYRDSKENFM